jgi:tripeptide aminopeptidase
MSDLSKFVGDAEIADRLLPRFLDYVRVWTTSDRHIADTPSSPGQWTLAKRLMAELDGMGVRDVELTDHCYLIVRLQASPGKESAPTIGFMAHLDTASDVSGQDVKPIVVEAYAGQAIEQAEGRRIDPATEGSDLASRLGDTIICSDGTTLLGADDKAGVAELMRTIEYLSRHPEAVRGPLEFVFTPDEETGKGLPDWPGDRLKMTACYTLDAGPAGELETECFNAYKADVDITGKVIHVGYARGKFANAAAMAAAYAAMLPRSESPESTDGYYGYYAVIEIRADMEKAHLEIYLRDFERAGMEKRVAALDAFARAVEAQFPGGKVEVKPNLQYLNMKEKIAARPETLARLLEAAASAGVATYLKPIRGGTDGSRLTEMGVPTPNVFAGGRNFHSRAEWASLADMVAATRTAIALVRLWAGGTV